MARQPMPKALSSLQAVQRSYTSELSVVTPVAVELKSLEFGVVSGKEGVVGVVGELLGIQGVVGV
jgi:hypothetical protein